MTVRYGNDAPSFRLDVRASLPAGVEVWATDPQDLPSFPDWFDVPGGRFMPGEERAGGGRRPGGRHHDVQRPRRRLSHPTRAARPGLRAGRTLLRLR
ncbi:hypothetical protein [Micromonospora aurantiaca (nom. illeg.)]|uniref:hypothetical protein n=1 Tax=Micromonospora aurantiaca (nom. illeg.) TaxID=47850 RepID=UPI003EB9FB95